MTDILFIILSIVGYISLEIIFPIVVKNKFNEKEFPKSFSDIYNILYDIAKKTGRHLEHLFTCWTSFNTLCLLPALIHYSSTLLSGLIAFISLGSLCYVGVFPIRINKDITTLHCIFAKMCAVCSLIWLVLEGYLLPSCMVGIVYIIFAGLCFVWARNWQKRYETLIMELVAFTLAYSGIILKALGV